MATRLGLVRDGRLRTQLAVATLSLVTFACAAAGASRTIDLETLSDSGVTGTVTLTDIGRSRTRVEVRVESAGNPDMPAHIHPGTCANLVPQPRYPLINVVNGVSTTEVGASLAELTAGDLAVNLHRSNEDMRTYTACADLR
jgi:hypothetical protein